MSSSGPIAPENLRRYVYLHVDPKSQQVVYVGKGTGGRAWDCAPTCRSKAHHQWILALLEQGFTPADYVQVIAKNLDEKQARELELSLIREHFSQPLFNLAGPEGFSFKPTLSPEQFKAARFLRANNDSYAKIAQEINSSTMTVWRALNSETLVYQRLEAYRG